MRRSRDRQPRFDRKGRIKLWALVVVMILLLGVFVTAVVQIASIQLERSAAAKEYEGLRLEIGPHAQSTAQSGEQAPRTPLGINPDYVGWLDAPGGNVDYPIVQGTDNDYYLHHTFAGEANGAGAIFMDYRNTEGFDSPHVVIYGHNMKDGTMFAGLAAYLDAGHRAAYPTITITTAGTTLTYAIFAARATDAWDAAYKLDFADDAAFTAFAKGLGAPEGTTQLLTLSTCTTGGEDSERVLVHAALLA